MVDLAPGSAAAFGSGVRAGHGLVRSSNLGLILRHLRDQGGRSRARIAADTGLSKAAASSLIADLVARGLVTEGELARGGAVGRPGLTVALDHERVRGIGVEINADYLALVVVDLCGEVVEEATRAVDIPAMSVDEALDAVADLVRPVLLRNSGAGRTVAGVYVAAPGAIAPDVGEVRLATNIGWHDVPVREAVCARLGLPASAVGLENDAKLGAVAAYAEVARDGVHDLVYVTGDVGVGAGIITGGTLLRGHDGYAGEVGHLPLDPEQRACRCGRIGCWELAVGLPPFLARAADAGDPVRDGTRPLEERLAVLRERALAGDRRTLEALQTTRASLGTGLSVIVDVLNPETVVLGGYFAWFGEWLAEQVGTVLQLRMIGRTATPVRVTVSRLGLSAAARGGAHLAIGTVFEDPTVIGPLSPSDVPSASASSRPPSKVTS